MKVFITRVCKLCLQKEHMSIKVKRQEIISLYCCYTLFVFSVLQSRMLLVDDLEKVQTDANSSATSFRIKDEDGSVK